MEKYRNTSKCLILAGVIENTMDLEELFHLYTFNEGYASSQFKQRILAIIHHCRFQEILEKLPTASRAVLMEILVCGGITPTLVTLIKSIPTEEAAQLRFIRILTISDWCDFEAATDFVLLEIEIGLQVGHML